MGTLLRWTVRRQRGEIRLGDDGALFDEDENKAHEIPPLLIF